MKPIAFFDIDGVLNRGVSNSVAKKRRLVRHHAWTAGNRWALWLDPKDRQRILRLTHAFDLGWGTTWEHDANWAVGVPLRLPWIDIVAETAISEYTKADGVVRAAAGRPFVWFDDDTADIEIEAEQQHKIFEVDSAEGLTDEHVKEAIRWAKDL